MNTEKSPVGGDPAVPEIVKRDSCRASKLVAQQSKQILGCYVRAAPFVKDRVYIRHRMVETIQRCFTQKG